MNEVCEIGHNLAKGIEKLGLTPTQTVDGRNLRLLGIQSKNRMEWGLSIIGSLHHTITFVSVYETFGEEACTFILN